MWLTDKSIWLVLRIKSSENWYLKVVVRYSAMTEKSILVRLRQCKHQWKTDHQAMLKTLCLRHGYDECTDYNIIYPHKRVHHNMFHYQKPISISTKKPEHYLPRVLYIQMYGFQIHYSITQVFWGDFVVPPPHFPLYLSHRHTSPFIR